MTTRKMSCFHMYNRCEYHFKQNYIYQVQGAPNVLEQFSKGCGFEQGHATPTKFWGMHYHSIFYLFSKFWAFIFNVNSFITKKFTKMCSKKLALAHTVYLGITKYFLINDCSLFFKMVYTISSILSSLRSDEIRL